MVSEYADKMIDAAKEAYNKDIKDLQEQLKQKDEEIDDLSGAISKWQAQHSDRIDEKNKLKARNLKLECVVEAATNLYDNRLGWSEGRSPYANIEFWDGLNKALKLNEDQRIKESER